MSNISKANCLKEIKDRTFISADYKQSKNEMTITIKLGSIMNKTNPILEAIKELDKRLTTRLDEHSKEFTKINSRLDEIDTTLDEHSKELTKINSRLDEHSKELTKINTTLDEHSKELTKINTRLDNLVSKNNLVE